MQQEQEIIHKARQIVSLEHQYAKTIAPKFPDISFAQWILSSNELANNDEFETLYKMGKVLAICENEHIPDIHQPRSLQCFQFLDRYIQHPLTLINIWKSALDMVEWDRNLVTPHVLGTVTSQYMNQHAQQQAPTSSLSQQSPPSSTTSTIEHSHVSQSQQYGQQHMYPSNNDEHMYHSQFAPSASTISTLSSHTNMNGIIQTHIPANNNSNHSYVLNDEYWSTQDNIGILCPSNDCAETISIVKKKKRFSDDLIICYWKSNPNSTFLAAQKKFNAGYSRVKRLKNTALFGSSVSIDNVMVDSSDENDSSEFRSKKRNFLHSNDDDDDDDGDDDYNVGPKKKKRKIYVQTTQKEETQMLDRKKEKKKRKTLATPSEFTIAAYASAEHTSLNNNAQRARRRQAWVTQTLKAVKKMCLDTISIPFSIPVDMSKVAAPYYDLVITQPMDFKTLQENLKNEKYENIKEFICDAELIFINAKLYNPPKHVIHTAAQKLQELFKSCLQSVVANHGDDETLKRWEMIDSPGGFAFGLEEKQNKRKCADINNKSV